MTPPADLLDAVLDIALRTGDRILDIYREGDFAVRSKDDHSPLTRADLAAHACIAAALAQLTPDVPLLSEEGEPIPWSVRRNWTRYWLVDPLDGTREFIRRNGEFTVNIALIEHGSPVLAAVHAPALARTYGAAAGVGAFRLHEGQRVAIRPRAVPARPLFMVSKSHRDATLEAWLASAPPHEAASRGSSLKFCLIAEGEADLYPRTGPISEWDTAAGQCVLEQAGGRVLRTPELTPLRYNQTESLLNPAFLAFGDPDYGWPQRLRAHAQP